MVTIPFSFKYLKINQVQNTKQNLFTTMRIVLQGSICPQITGMAKNLIYVTSVS